jgi:hypothetical protein
MPTVNFTIKNKKNRGLIINSNELLAFYFYGIDIVNQQGTSMDSDTIETYIRMAQQELEKFLGVKLIKQVIDEQSDYYRDEFQGSGFVKTKYTVNEALQLEGWIGDYKQLAYPKEWLTENKVNGLGTSRQILVVPNSNTNTVSINAALFAGSTFPHLGLVNTNQIGSYWRMSYITGFGCGDELPYDLINVIGKYASLNLFNVLGDLILGAGIASQSLSLDGLSQSIASTASATSGGYGARIIQYSNEIKESLKRLTGIYKGISITSI